MVVSMVSASSQHWHCEMYLAVVEVTLENDKVGTRKVEEKIGSLIVELPEREASAPEGVLLIHPLLLLLVLLNVASTYEYSSMWSCR